MSSEIFENRELYYGNYRAKVVSNKDEDDYGRVKVWIPDIMPEISDLEGIWAFPANNPIGGRNSENSSDNYYMGTCFIPANGSWVWIFFECGNINRPFYFGALELQNSKVLPENRGSSDKWTIFKSHEGRTITISDDPLDCRVEITGKKRLLNKAIYPGPNMDTIFGPEGNLASTLQIDGNQTTILLDERDGFEKLLIRTWLGDYIKINILRRELYAFFLSGITVQSLNDVVLKGRNIILDADNGVYIQSKNNINLISNTINRRANTTISDKSYGNIYSESTLTNNIKGSIFNIDATAINKTSVISKTSPLPKLSKTTLFMGERNI